MRLLAALSLAAALGLIGSEYAAIGVAMIGLAVACYAHVRLGRVSDELRDIQQDQRRVAESMAKKADTIDSEIRSDDPDA